MAKQYANIQPGFDTFSAWLTKTNNILDDMSNIIITTASNTSGAITTGNAYVNGTFSGITGAFTTIRGGNVNTNAVLTIASNVSIANSYSMSFGNATVNTTINATSFSGIANTANGLTTARNLALTTDATGNANFDGTANLTIAVTLANSGVVANTYGNTTVYPIITVDSKGRLTSVSAQTVYVAPTGVTAFNTRTGNVLLTAADITGNSTVGLNYTPVSANTSGTITGSLTLTSGDLTVRDVLSSRDIRSGNATVYTVTNATSFSGVANTATALATARNLALTTDATGNANFDGTANLTIAVTLASTGVTANTYGNSTVYPVITVDTKGRVTSVSSQTVTVAASGVTTFNTRNGAVLLTAADITGNSTVGLNYTPVSANTSGTITGSLTLTSGDLTVRDIISSRDIRSGNATVNTVVNAVSISIGNAVLTATTLSIGNATVNTAVNATNFATGTITSNSATILYFGANTTLSNNYIIAPALKGYSEFISANTGTTGATTLDLSTSNFFNLTLTGNTTFTFTNAPSNRAIAFTIVATQDATGGRTITWPSTIRWSGGVAPPATTTATAVDIWNVLTYDGGTTYSASLSNKDSR